MFLSLMQLEKTSSTSKQNGANGLHKSIRASKALAAANGGLSVV
jgi:hypothetical protein